MCKIRRPRRPQSRKRSTMRCFEARILNRRHRPSGLSHIQVEKVGGSNGAHPTRRLPEESRCSNPKLMAILICSIVRCSLCLINCAKASGPQACRPPGVKPFKPPKSPFKQTSKRKHSSRPESLASKHAWSPPGTKPFKPPINP